MSGDVIEVPWTPEQVEALNDFQREGLMHGYTCGKCRSLLLATPSGWICSNDDWRQNWALAFMADREVHRLLRAGFPPAPKSAIEGTARDE